MNPKIVEEIFALYENVLSQMEEIERENNLYYLNQEYSILNGQKGMLLEVIRLVY